VQNLLRISTHGGQVILDLLESRENLLTVRGDIGVIRGGVLVELRATESAIKNSLGDGRPNRPEAAWPLKEVLECRAFEAPVSRECNVREERVVTNSNDGVVFHERALRGGNVRPAHAPAFSPIPVTSTSLFTDCKEPAPIPMFDPDVHALCTNGVIALRLGTLEPASEPEPASRFRGTVRVPLTNSIYWRNFERRQSKLKNRERC
jgi:hypothetical protein